MPHTASARKRHRQDLRRQAANRSLKRSARTWIKRVETAIAHGDAKQARADLRVATQVLGKAARQRVFHPNKAARDQARLARAVGKAESAGAGAPKA